jgi:hypothetical protein
MARVGRLAGALVAESQGSYFLVGELKEPCDFERAGFAPPGELAGRPFVRLDPIRPIALSPPTIDLDVEGEALPTLLHERLVITRNQSVSERLWRLIVQGEERQQARWFGEVPSLVWNIVRDGVLKCS